MVTVATDSAAMYGSELLKSERRYFPSGFDQIAAAETFGQHLLGVRTDSMAELTLRDRDRIFNLGYFTWVEQQGVSLADFEARRSQRFWRGLRSNLPKWDAAIAAMNQWTTAEGAT